MTMQDFHWQPGMIQSGDRVLVRNPNDPFPDSLTVTWYTVSEVRDTWINVHDGQGHFDLISPELIYTRRRGNVYLHRAWCPLCTVETFHTVRIVALVPIDHERNLRVGDRVCQICQDFKTLFTARE